MMCVGIVFTKSSAIYFIEKLNNEAGGYENPV